MNNYKFYTTFKIYAILLVALSACWITVKAEENNQKPLSADEIKSRLDGTDENVNTLLSDVAGLKKLKISGYLQIQFDKTESFKGLSTNPYDSASNNQVQSRFRVRRSRLKFAYDAGLTQFVVQGDFSNEKFELKDAYLNITDPWTKKFSLTAGVFNRPNYEVEYSSSQRESMERSAVVKALYPSERDLGAMITFYDEDLFKIQFAGFNNTIQGDLKQFYPNFNNEPLYFMTRITKEILIPEAGFGIDFGVNARFGNVIANNYKIITPENNSSIIDSTSTKKGDVIGRNWLGGELQLYYDFLGGMKILGEYITGSDINEMTLVSANKVPAPIRKRNFVGYYIMLVKNISSDWQFALKYDFYNPNTKISDDIKTASSELTINTLGLGIHNYSFENVRISVWYDMPKTASSTPAKVTADPKDNYLTIRFQYKF